MADWIAQPTWATGETVSSVKLGKHAQGITHVKERWDRAMVLTGSTDAAVGDLLVLDPSVTDGVALASAAGEAGPILVALEALDAGGVAGQVRAGGFVTLNISDDVARGDFVQVSSTGLGELAPDASTAFAIATSGATAPGQVSVLMLPVAGVGGGGGGSGSGLFAFMPTLVPPVLSSLTKINESVKVHTQEGDAVRIWTGQIDTYPTMRILAHTPATPHWHFRALVLLDGPRACIDALALNMADGNKSVLLRFTQFDGDAWRSGFDVWTSPTVHGGAISSGIGATPMNPIWLHVMWDGTNMKFGYSASGQDPAMLYSTTPAAAATSGWTSGHAPDAYGIAIEGQGSLYNQSHLILSWEELALP